MSKEAASVDLQAAAYWKDVLRSDRAEAGVAIIKVQELTIAAQQEEKAPAEAQRRTRGLGMG